MANRKLLLLALVVTFHCVSGEEDDTSETTNEIFTAGKKLYQSARQLDLFDDDGTGAALLLGAALLIPLLGLLSLLGVLAASSFVYRYAYTGFGNNLNTLGAIGTGVNTGVTTGTFTGRRKRSAFENSQLAKGLSYVQKMLDNAERQFS